MSSVFRFGKMKKVLEIDSGDGCTTLLMQLMPLNYILKIDNMIHFMLFIFPQ